jgi:serine/threonine-protein kinase HipA
LSPAFDISYAYNPSGAWTNQHQMTINNKRENFSMDDIFSLGEFAGVKKAKVKKYINQVNQAFSFWPIYAEQEKIDSQTIQSIQSVIRYDLKA